MAIYTVFRTLPRHGSARADLWFWGQTLRTIPALLLGGGRDTSTPLAWELRADLGQAWRALRRRRGFAAL